MSVESVALTCPRCESPVSADARFCMSCGLSLETDALAAARQTRLLSAAPTSLVEKMRSAKLTGERKPVTALFADVVGSTTLAEQMDPEDWTQIINEAFDLMSKAVFRYEGTIAQLQGDAMLAFFGAPVAHEDDPERAVRAALEMIEQCKEFARQLKVSHGIDFQIRAGLNSGPVIVGNVGSDLRYEYTALGDAVNVAARVQTAAEPGTVLVTSMTERFITGTFEFEDRGEVEVKGKAEPLHLYRVIGLRAVRASSRGLEQVGLSSPMVGRATELEALIETFQVVRAGHGRVAVVLGEPGIGKSRLLSELRSAIGATGESVGAAWIEGRCVSYGRSVPYHLVFDLVRSMLDLPQTGLDVLPRATLDERLEALLGQEAADVIPYFAHLLAMPLSPAETDLVQIDPEVLQHRYVAAISRVIRQITETKPVVLVCEDIHWSDPASVDVMLLLVPLITPLSVLILFVGRAETDSPGWRLVSQPRSSLGDALTEVRLQPLSEGDSRELVSNLLEIESLPESVRQRILTRSEGNPFFVEEVIRMLIGRGAIVRSGDRWMANDTITGIDIPDTLHGLLLARIDQLPDAAKRSLRVASVIGRQFPVRVLERVLESSTDAEAPTT
jgi:class 3 adenylate cyclase